MDSICSSEAAQEPPGYVEKFMRGAVIIISSYWSKPSPWTVQERAFFKVLHAALTYDIVDIQVVYQQFYRCVDSREREKVLEQIGKGDDSVYFQLRSRFSSSSQVCKMRFQRGEEIAARDPKQLMRPLKEALEVILYGKKLSVIPTQA